MRYTVNRAINKVKSNMPDSPLKNQQKHTAQRATRGQASREAKDPAGVQGTPRSASGSVYFLRRDHHHSG